MNTSSGIGVSTESVDTMNEDTPVGVASAVKEGVTPSVVDMTVEMENISSLEYTTLLGSFPSLSMPVTTTAGNAPGKRVAYPVVANYVRNTWGKYGLVRSMFSSSTGLFSFQFSSMKGLNAMLENVWVKLHGVPVTAISEDGLSAIATKLGTPLMLDSYASDMCMQSWGRSTYARGMIELRADVELKDNIVVAMAKIIGEGHYICNVRVEYEWKPPRCASCKVFGHIHEECPKNTGAEYKPIPKKTTAISSGNKKKGVEPTIEVSNSNPFEVLNSVDNDVKLGNNRGITNLVNNRVTSSGSSFMNVDNSSTGTTPIIDKIGKFEELLTSGQAILVDEAGNPLKKVEFPGFGIQSLLKQWRDSYGNGDYDEDPYDDDMYEGQDLPQELQAICDNLDIRVRGRKKK
ncbi:cytokinin dehydrogenase 3-like protein [Tanacetum coccineum]